MKNRVLKEVIEWVLVVVVAVALAYLVNHFILIPLRLVLFTV